MFPTLPIRLLVAATVLLGAWLLASLAPALYASDGSASLTLMMAHGGLIAAVGLILFAALPVIGMSAVCSSLGNPLCGLFALSTALWILSAQGSTMDAWIRRTNAILPGDYLKLAIECLIWSALLAGYLLLVVKVRPKVRVMLPMLAKQPHLGEELTLSRKWLPALVSGAVAAIIGGVLASFLLQTPNKGQVVGGLIIAFTIGGLVGDMVSSFLFQKHPANPMGVIIAPMLVAIVGYLLAMFSYKGTPEFLNAYFNTHASGLALALPIDYAGAGVAGAAMGAGWSQVMLHNEAATEPAASAKAA